MGSVRMGAPESIVLLLRDTLNVNTFVESGTFKGRTAVWAAKNFDRVITIENTPYRYNKASQTYKDKSNIQFVLGDSITYLRDHIHELPRAIFWLDAHKYGEETAGENKQCPVMEELGIILSSGQNHSILIDDARLILSPAPSPNSLEYWPTIDLVIEKIRSSPIKYYIVVFEDVIIAVPPEAKQALMSYCRVQNTQSWARKMNRNPYRVFRWIIKGVAKFSQRYTATDKKEQYQ